MTTPNELGFFGTPPTEEQRETNRRTVDDFIRTKSMFLENRFNYLMLEVERFCATNDNRPDDVSELISQLRKWKDDYQDWME